MWACFYSMEGLQGCIQVSGVFRPKQVVSAGAQTDPSRPPKGSVTERRKFRLKPALQAQPKTAIIPKTSKKASSAQGYATGVARATGWRGLNKVGFVPFLVGKGFRRSALRWPSGGMGSRAAEFWGMGTKG